MKDKVKFIKDLAKSINTYSVDSVEYENEDFKIKIKIPYILYNTR